jgi:signal transduction histidine kinase
MTRLLYLASWMPAKTAKPGTLSEARRVALPKSPNKPRKAEGKKPSRPPVVAPPSSRRRPDKDEFNRRVSELEAKVAELDSLLGRAERTVRALRDVGLALGSTLDLDQLLELILGKIAELLEADRATLYLLDEQRQRLLSRIIIGDEAKSIELPVGSGIAGHVAKFGQTLRIKDAYRDRRFSRHWDEMTGYRTRSILAAPMKNHVGRTIGVIQVLNKRSPVVHTGPVSEQSGEFSRSRSGAAPSSRGKSRPTSFDEPGWDGEFSQYDEELLTALSTQAAVSIDNSRLFLSVIQKNMQLVETKEQLEHRVQDLKLLFELESSMARASSFSDLAKAVVVEAARACGAEAGGMMVDEGEEGVFLYFVDATKGKHPEVKRVGVRRGEGILGLAMRTNEAQHLPPSSASRMTGPPVSSRLGSVLGIEVKSSVAMPLEGSDDSPIGALALYNATRQGGFSQDARALLRLISANASTAVRLFVSRIEREQGRRLSSLGRLFSGIVHDLRGPLAVISGYAQLMATTDDRATRSEQAKVILKQFDAIAAMQREILEFARGERSLLIRRLFLEKFFNEVEQQLQRDLEGTKVKMQLELKDRGTARFDELKISRVIANLARNAIEAMSERGGTLTLRVERDGDDLVITVADTGRGIPEEVRRKLFASFVTSGKRGGTGLGLSIVKKIVDDHRGTVSAESSAAGTKFVVRLPQTEAEGLVMRPVEDEVESPPVRRKSVPPPAAKSRSAASTVRERRELLREGKSGS